MPTKVTMFKVGTSVLSIGASNYALINLHMSGLLPIRFIVASVIVCSAVSALLLFCMFRVQKSKVRIRIMRSVAGILVAILLLVSLAGTYALNRGMSVLNKVSDKPNAIHIETSKTFNVFISGIDTYGDISSQSRSDVNIVATINPDTRKVLLTTAPRDSYVSIALGGNDGMDKLTHAGNYGIESSMKTLARLLHTDIDAYARINFTTFIESIDKLGGVTINNPTAFTIEGVTFPVGELRLDGKKALLYSRERKSLQGGDVDRGKNQQRIIQGIINELTQIRSLSGFEVLLELIGNSVQTNISSETMKQLINDQLNNPSSWTTNSYVLTGRGQTGGLPSYAMPGAQLYVYVLDEDSIKKAARQIKAEF